MAGLRKARGASWLTVCCLAAAVAGCSTSPLGLPGREVLGGGTSSPLTLERASPSGAVKVSEADARRTIERPFAAPDLDGPLRQFGLARVTAADLAAEGTTPPRFHGRLAWVGIYEISKSGAHSCPGQPPPLPSSLPPVFDRYYFVVLVDARSGQQATWNEDMSGLLLRECAGASAG